MKQSKSKREIDEYLDPSRRVYYERKLETEKNISHLPFQTSTPLFPEQGFSRFSFLTVFHVRAHLCRFFRWVEWLLFQSARSADRQWRGRAQERSVHAALYDENGESQRGSFFSSLHFFYFSQQNLGPEFPHVADGNFVQFEKMNQRMKLGNNEGFFLKALDSETLKPLETGFRDFAHGAKPFLATNTSNSVFDTDIFRTERNLIFFFF